MSFPVIETQPKRNPAPLDPGGRSMEEISDEYFSTISPIGRKIMSEKRKCMDLHRRDWDRLTQKEKDSILDEWLIDPKLQMKYELKLGKKVNPVTKSFPRLKVESGGKVVHYSEQEDGSQSQSKETVSWKDEFSGPFCWETKCQQELTILTPETISASSVPSPSITHDLIKVSDPDVETDAEWFAKSNKDKSKLSVMLMRDVNNRNSLGNNLLASSSERLAFDQAVNTALAGKPKPKDKATANGYGKAEGRRPSQEESQEKRKKTNNQGPTEKPKPVPPASVRKGNGSKDSLIQELDKKLGSGSKGKDKNSFPQSLRRDSGSKSTEVASPRKDSSSKSGGISSPRRDSGSKGGLSSPRRESGSKKKSEKKQLLPSGLVTELEKELKVQDNVNFDMGKQQKEERGQGDAAAEETNELGEATSYEFLFDW